jgi:hypothetical protein
MGPWDERCGSAGDVLVVIGAESTFDEGAALIIERSRLLAAPSDRPGVDV